MTNLFPFMSAAVQNKWEQGEEYRKAMSKNKTMVEFIGDRIKRFELDTVYELLRHDPTLVDIGIPP